MQNPLKGKRDAHPSLSSGVTFENRKDCSSRMRARARDETTTLMRVCHWKHRNPVIYPREQDFLIRNVKNVIREHHPAEINPG